MAISIEFQGSYTLTRGVILTIPARVGRKSMTIQAPRGTYYIGYNQDPTESDSFVTRIHRESHGMLRLDGAFPGQGNNTDFYEGDVRLLYLGSRPTRNIWVIELS